MTVDDAAATARQASIDDVARSELLRYAEALERLGD